VNRRFAIDMPYIMLDALVNAWAARSDVQNWCRVRPVTVRLVASARTATRPAGTRSGRASSSYLAERTKKGGESAPSSCV